MRQPEVSNTLSGFQCPSVVEEKRPGDQDWILISGITHERVPGLILGRGMLDL